MFFFSCTLAPQVFLKHCWHSLRGFENVTQLLFAATFGMYD